MRKLSNMVIIEESIGDGFINENGKKVVSTKTKTYSRSKEWAEKNSSDETLKVLGDAYEVFSVIQGKKVRQVVTLEKAEQIESKKEVQQSIFLEPKLEDETNELEDNLEDDLEDSEDELEEEEEKTIKPAKRGRKKAEQKEI